MAEQEQRENDADPRDGPEPEVARTGSGTETPQPRVEVAQPGRKPSADGLELMGPETADVAQEYGENGAAAEMLIRPKEAHHSRAAYRVGLLQYTRTAIASARVFGD